MLSVPDHRRRAHALPARRAGAVHRPQERDAGRDGPDRAWRMLFGFFFVETLQRPARHGRAAGHRRRQLRRRAVARLAAGSRRSYKGLAMGIVGAGNVGHGGRRCWSRRRWRSGYGWQAVYGVAALRHADADGGDDRSSPRSRPTSTRTRRLREHVACLFEKDGWAFSLIYVRHLRRLHRPRRPSCPPTTTTSSASPRCRPGQLTMLAAFMGAAVRVVGGWISDRWGGVNTLTAGAGHGRRRARAVRPRRRLAGRSPRCCSSLCFAALGAGNGALFQLVPLRWPPSHRGGRLDDRRDRRARRRPRAQRDGPVEAVHRHATSGASCCSRCSRW